MPTSTENINSGTKEYVIERLSQSNLDDVARLHAAVYNVAPPFEHFKRKYNTAYTGVEYAGLIAYFNNEPIAYYGVIPCFIQYNNEIFLAAQSADTMTHPGYRFKGLFVELSLKTFDLCKELGISLVFGFPNENSYHGAVTKLGWKMTGSMEAFVIPVKSVPLAKIAGKIRFLQPLYKSYRRSALKKKHLSGDRYC